MKTMFFFLYVIDLQETIEVKVHDTCLPCLPCSPSVNDKNLLAISFSR